MSLQTANIQSHKKIGACPHGMPFGACSICNGMAGGNSTTKRDIPRRVGEMTYNQCAAIGAMLKAQKHSKEQAKIVEQNRVDALAKFQTNIINAHSKIVLLNSILSKNLPIVISAPIVFINNIAINILKFIVRIPNTIAAINQFIIQKFVDISDKLTAIYGELKNSINEKLSKVISNFKKKIKSFFFIFSGDEVRDEEKKIEEEKRVFELKTFIQKIFNREQETEGK